MALPSLILSVFARESLIFLTELGFFFRNFSDLGSASPGFFSGAGGCVVPVSQLFPASAFFSGLRIFSTAAAFTVLSAFTNLSAFAISLSDSWSMATSVFSTQFSWYLTETTQSFSLNSHFLETNLFFSDSMVVPAKISCDLRSSAFSFFISSVSHFWGSFHNVAFNSAAASALSFVKFHFSNALLTFSLCFAASLPASPARPNISAIMFQNSAHFFQNIHKNFPNASTILVALESAFNSSLIPSILPFISGVTGAAAGPVAGAVSGTVGFAGSAGLTSGLTSDFTSSFFASFLISALSSLLFTLKTLSTLILYFSPNFSTFTVNPLSYFSIFFFRSSESLVRSLTLEVRSFILSSFFCASFHSQVDDSTSAFFSLWAVAMSLSILAFFSFIFFCSSVFLFIVFIISSRDSENSVLSAPGNLSKSLLEAFWSLYARFMSLTRFSTSPFHLIVIQLFSITADKFLISLLVSIDTFCFSASYLSAKLRRSSLFAPLASIVLLYSSATESSGFAAAAGASCFVSGHAIKF
ncbi:MAG: hypothetical protein ACD_2C00019G0001 [uncultured bacterium (gcode 4)]|uniref:Uncharacterized protein n=1 Tax=uncultured bacterium (gcode 4) TaxID=1234023 RepID=K2FGG8_9BACT|nr:MAG: hypothetical protein ACD_2C00019G0001 [uncultured bacterium (gcode 4)]